MAKAKDGDIVVIKKYANRRLYNTQSSTYITLDHLAKMVREEIDFKVVDAKTGDDITHQVLTQIIVDEESHGEQMLPVSFLRQLISMYGKSMQGLLPQYLEASMDHFRDNQQKLRTAFESTIESNPLAKIAQRNMEMFKAAATAFIPGGAGTAAPQEKPAAAPSDELSALREQMAAMQKKLEELGK